MRLKSYAKINLFLKIIGKRSDGFHEILTRFQTIDLFDELTIELAEEDFFSCTDPNLPLDEKNLVIKARNLFRKETGIHHPVRIHLIKNIPSEGGLGGGSSNAAVTLSGLQQLFKTTCDLHFLASQLGSDINFFLVGGTALGKGRGEIIEAEGDYPLTSFYLVKPPYGCSTPQVFKNVKLPLESSPGPFYNDLETPAFIVEPRLKELKKELANQGLIPILSGSGSSFFCFGSQKPNLPDTYFVKAVNPVSRDAFIHQ
jgi:4-diphosphocytidyl-2-C-methyl-D-erythritol kinase